MPPSKRPPKFRSGKGKKEIAIPQTANEYLAAADDEEVTGSKWRPGDAAKAMRAYLRAFDIYEEGLRRFPKDFDLAYNKANLQYLIVTDVRLREQAGVNALGLLSSALESHRYALSLDESNADVLYNTAQVLISIAEEIEDDDDDEFENEESSSLRTIPLLQEAVELFESCAAKQEMQYEELQASAESVEPPAPVDADASSVQDDDSPDIEEWAVVAQPVTPITLLETSTATLTAMTSLVSAYVAGPKASSKGSSELAAITSLAKEVLDVRIPINLQRLLRMPPQTADMDDSNVLSLSTTSGRATRKLKIKVEQAVEIEVALAAALFRASIAEAEYRLQLTGVSEYASRLKDAFEALTTPPNSVPSHLFAYTQSLAELASVIAEQERNGNVNQTLIDEATTVSWQGLSTADESLGRVITILNDAIPFVDVSPPSKTSAYLLRGDVSLHRWRLATKPHAAKSVSDAAAVLLKNAGVYFRGAAKLASTEVGEDDSGVEAALKARIVARIGGEQIDITLDEDVESIVRDMVDEGLVNEELLSRIL